jgi:hypothetical protein
MVEQMTMWEATNYEEPKKDEETKLTPRQWALYRLIRHYSLDLGKKITQREICDLLPEYYKWNDDIKTHDHCVMIWGDIKNLSLSYEIDKIVISDNYEYWLGDKTQTDDFINGLWDDLFPRLSRYWAYKRKVARNGQGKLLSDQLQPIDDEAKIVPLNTDTEENIIATTKQAKELYELCQKKKD